MLGNINKLLTKITSDKVRGGASSNVGSPSHSSALPDSGRDYTDEEQTAEGFLCPHCMVKCISPEELQSHYENAHAQIGHHVCPICKDKFATGDQLQIHYASDHASTGVQTLNGDLQILRNELAEMQTTLREERWYSEELKKEVTRLGGVVDREEAQENLSMKQQIKSLEESKSLLTSEIVLLRKQLGEAVETHMLVKQQKDNLEQKLTNCEKEVEKLQKSNANFEEELKNKFENESGRQLADEKRKIEAVLNSTKDKNNVLSEENQKLKKNADKMAEKILERESKVVKLVSELENLNKLVDEMKQEQKSAFEQNKQLQSQIDTLLNELSMLKDEKAKLGTVQQQLQNELESVSHLKETSDMKSQELVVKLSQVEKLFEEEKTKFDSQKEKALAERKELQIKIEQLKNDFSEKCLQIDKLSIEAIDRESLLSKCQLQFDDLQSEFKAQSSEFEKVKLEVLDLNMELEKRKRTQIQLENRTSDLEAQVTKQEAVADRLNQERDELYLKIEAGEGIGAAIQQLQLENASLTETIAKQQKTFTLDANESSKKIEDLHQQNSELKKQLEISREKCSKMESAYVDVMSKLKTAEERYEQSENKLSKLSLEMSTKEASWMAQQTKMENSRLELEASLNVNNQLLVESKEQCSKLESQSLELFNQLQLKCAALDELEENVSALKGRCAQLRESHEIKEVEWKEQVCNVENIRSSLQQEVAQLTSEKSFCAEEIKRLKRLIDKDAHSLLAAVSNIRSDLAFVKESVSAVGTNVVQTCNQLSNDVERLHSNYKSTTELFKEEKASVAGLQTCIKNFDNTIKELESEKSSLKQAIDVAESEAKKWCKIQGDNESSLNIQKNELETLRRKLSLTQSQLEENEKRLREFESVQQQNNLQIEQLRADEQQLKQQLADCESMKHSLEGRLKCSETKLSTAVETQQVIALQKTSLETELFESQKTYSDLEEKYSRLEVAKSDLENLLIATKADMQNQLAKLEEARDILTSQKLELITKISAYESELQKEKSDSEIMQTNHKQMVDKLSLQITEFNARISDLNEQVRVSKVKKGELKTRCEMQVTALQENLSTLQGDVLGYREKVKGLETQIDETLGEKLELEAKLENATDERRALLERCLSSEADCEKLRTSTLELRRKLDDALSALHELGRENQTLQMETAKLSNRKWTDDSEVHNCTACQKLFSVTIRKHHCRNCGNIYCSECSSKTATITSSKKPVRVCDGCYNEITK